MDENLVEYQIGIQGKSPQEVKIAWFLDQYDTE